MNTGSKGNGALLGFISVICLLCYAWIAYLLPRTSFGILIVLITVLFVLYALLTAPEFAQANFSKLLGLAILSRLIFLFAVPSLSDDYFRFVWDGVLDSYGINPYLFVPASFNQMNGGPLPGFMLELKANMNSLPYFSPYPPVLQAMFLVSVKLGGFHLAANIIVLRIMGLLAEVGIIFIAVKLMDHFKLPRNRVLLYALNPLVIIELTGNLHGEVVMIFLLLLSLFFLVTERSFLSAIVLGLAIATKLLPLIFLPAIFSFIGIRRGIRYSLIVALTVTASFLPFVNAVFVQHIAESVGYYFQKFEFNASIYYVLRWIGYTISGYNLIYFIGKLLPVIVFVLIMRMAFLKKITTSAMLFEKLLFTLLIYYLFSLIVHPWYITVLATLSIFTVYRFALVWSALVMLSYSTYLQIPYHEIWWVTAIEYMILAGVLYLEIRKRKGLVFFKD